MRTCRASNPRVGPRSAAATAIATGQQLGDGGGDWLAGHGLVGDERRTRIHLEAHPLAVGSELEVDAGEFESEGHGQLDTRVGNLARQVEWLHAGLVAVAVVHDISPRRGGNRLT